MLLVLLPVLVFAVVHRLVLVRTALLQLLARFLRETRDEGLSDLLHGNLLG